MDHFVLGVRVDNLNEHEALEKVRSFLHSDTQHFVFTPNPEMLVDAYYNDELKGILNTGSLNICDGRGIEYVLKGEVKRLPGVDFMDKICALAEETGSKIYLLGSGQVQIVERTKRKLLNKYPGLNIVGTHAGPSINKNFKLDKIENERIIRYINNAKPDIIFVAFGHPKQEKWISTYLSQIPSSKLAMGVGGSFDFISGKIKRAPVIVRRAGLEWLWRLILQPWRLSRIWKATGHFLYLYYFKSPQNTDHI